MLELNGVTIKYGNLHALDGLTLTLEDGSCCGLVGPNGAGKTTAIRTIMGLILPEEGEVRIDGQDAVRNPSLIKDAVGYVPDAFGIYENLTVREYMEFFASAYGLYGLSARKRYMLLLEQVQLDDKLDFSVDMLSRGMQQRLCLARALIHDPRILIMDEPMNGLDPGTRFEFRQIVGELHAQGKTILISSHILSELSQMCTDIGILENGRILLNGRLEDIMEQIENSNPIRLSVVSGAASALAVLRENRHVRSISENGNTFLLGFRGTRTDESALLYELISAEIPVREFVREPGSLEKYFMQITSHKEEITVLKNED